MQVMDIVDRLFVSMFDSLNERCQKELEAIGKQYPFMPLKVILVSTTFFIAGLLFIILIFIYTCIYAKFVSNKQN